MVGRKNEDLPAALMRARDRFSAWRRTRKLGTRIPASLWTLASRVAVKYGVARTATVLGLDYYALKERAEQQNSNLSTHSSSEKSEFVELALPPVATSGECVIVFEDGEGARMRVHMKGCQAPDLLALGHGFWNAE